MTDEEIKQKAEQYAEKHYDIPFEDNSSMNVIVSEESYIAGAHSRDEEIEQLERLLKMSTDTTDEMTRRIIKLREEIEKLKKK